MNETKVRSIRDVLSRSVRDVVISEGANVSFSPSQTEFADCFARVRLNRFEDLQMLGFVPRRLAEEKLRQAIATDDDEARRIIVGTFVPKAECGCAAEEGSQRASHRTIDLATSYRQLRKTHHPSLARLLSEHYDSPIPWNDPIASQTAAWISFFDRSKIHRDLIVAALRDLTIQKKATLHVHAATRSLLANDIRIHREGSLYQAGSYLRIWANSIASFRDLHELVTSGPSATPWLLNE